MFAFRTQARLIGLYARREIFIARQRVRRGGRLSEDTRGLGLPRIGGAIAPVWLGNRTRSATAARDDRDQAAVISARNHDHAAPFQAAKDIAGLHGGAIDPRSESAVRWAAFAGIGRGDQNFIDALVNGAKQIGAQHGAPDVGSSTRTGFSVDRNAASAHSARSA
ncbi:MAG: hypothetical protein P4L68_08100 [Methylovirgula sp.]|nr:hypothetical protein [Methylovirgula sp.]